MNETPYTQGFRAGQEYKIKNELDFETRLDLVQIELDEIGKIIKELEKSLNEFAETFKVGK